MPGCPEFTDERSFKRHLQTAKIHVTSHTPQYQCSCAKSYTRWYKFREHLIKCQLAATGSYRCPCNQGFNTLIAITEHYEKVHRGKRGRPRKRKGDPEKDNL
jgi:hypothetical protein